MDPEVYNRFNNLQLEEGKQLIKTAADENNNEIDYILDIGCGSGNLTVLLNQIAPKMKRVYAIDIDPKMIEFAKQNNSGINNNIEYLVQDFGVQWNQLRLELRELEGNVSIIFSNLVLHWIYTKRDNVAENIYRLLSKKGRVYSKLLCLPHPTDKINGMITEFLVRKFVTIATKEEQESEWTQSFKSAGFDFIDINYKSVETICKVNDFDRCIALDVYFNALSFTLPISPYILGSTSLFFGIYEQFYSPYLMNTLRFLAYLFGFKCSAYLPKFKDETTGQTMCVTKYEQFTFKLEKN